jgi:hypothetical protein
MDASNPTLISINKNNKRLEKSPIEKAVKDVADTEMYK